MGFKYSANKYIIKLLEKGNLLDLACGEGELIREAKRRGIKCLGVDIDKRKKPDIVYSLEKRLPVKSDSFSQVSCIDSLEHIRNITKLFKEIKRVIKKNGVFIFSLPNTKFYRSHNHKSYFTYKLAMNLIQLSGFKLEKEIYFFHIPIISADMRVPNPIISSHMIFKVRK